MPGLVPGIHESRHGRGAALASRAALRQNGPMKLSWNEIRARAAAFAEEWKDASYEKGEAQSFYNDFFEAFGVRRRTVARYEEHVAKLDNSHGYIDLFWPGKLIVEQKSAGRDLRKAYDQAGEYFDALPERERSRFCPVPNAVHAGSATGYELSRRARSIVGNAGVHSHRDASTVRDRFQQTSDCSRRTTALFRYPDFGDAYGLDADSKRAT